MTRLSALRRCAALLSALVALSGCQNSTDVTPPVQAFAAAVYGTVQSASGASVVGTKLHAVGFVDGCSSGGIAEGYGAVAEPSGRYRFRVTALGPDTGCVVVFVVGSDTPFVGSTVAFRPNVDVGEEDSVRVDITVP